MERISCRQEKGFTLIELMIVIGIIGILSAIAIPQYSSYRSRSYNAAAVSDLKSAEIAQEVYFAQNLTYCANTASLAGTTYMLLMSRDVNLTITATSTGPNGYVMRTRHLSGDATFIIQGPGGSIQKE